MSATGKQSPLGINVLGAVLQNTGFYINPQVTKYLGTSKTNATYTPGSIVQDTCLRVLVHAINKGYTGYIASGTPNSTTYNNLISIGSTTIPALGNSKPPTYIISNPSGQWNGVANRGYYIAGTSNQGQAATWIPYDTTNPNVGVTQWGFLRNYALQAWSEFNWNGEPTFSVPEYKDFCSSFMTVQGFIDYNNSSIKSSANAPTFLQGTFSNMTDMITADVSGVNLALPAFGQDCITAGRAIDLSKIVGFGLPSILLQNIKKNNALTPSLVLALLSSGLTNQEITNISKNNASGITKKQEQLIYGAFLIILGQDLLDILIPLNCKTKGIESLADLLNVQKLFPNSYQSMTVPIYNATPTVTNSKTYYPIYSGTAVNSAINTPAVKAQIGTIVIPGTPPITETTYTTEQNGNTSVQVLSEGFGSYLDGILPIDIAVATGAFAFSMQQVKNIQNAEFEKFSQVVASLETTKGLNLLNTGSLPVNTTLSNQVSSLLSLGSGPDGQYTTSDFFGSMSGLPYLWNDIYTGVKDLGTTTLAAIYHNLCLAAGWNGATASVQYSTGSELEVPAGTYKWYYDVTGVTLTNGGGGYSRGGAGAPSVSITGSSGATASTTIDSNDLNLPGTFGQVSSITLTSAGSRVYYATGQISPTPGAVPSPPEAQIQAPPTSVGGGSNTAYGTAGWPGMNAVTQLYIDAANAEIASIQSSRSSAANDLNVAYNAAGTQLMIEQRARFIGIPAVPSPNRDDALNTYPTSLTIFVDAIPGFGKSTKPHMYCQTLEAISDMSITGGQSIIGLMREARNQARLQEVGIPLDNTVPDTLTDPQTSLLISNGTIQLGVNNAINGFTMPSSLVNPTAPAPVGFFSEVTDKYYATNCLTDVNAISPLVEIMASTGPCTCAEEEVKAGARIPCDNGTAIDTGQAYPGSLAGSPYSELIPPELNGAYISATVLPANYNVAEAVAKVTNPTGYDDSYSSVI